MPIAHPAAWCWDCGRARGTGKPGTTQPSDPHDKLFRALLDDPERARALQVVEYVGRVYDMTRAELETAVRQAKPHRWEEIMGTPAEEWIEEGKQRGKAEGRAEGKAEGMAQGRAEAVLRILRGRFGEPDAWLAERIRSADLDALDGMLDLALTVEKPDDVIRGAGQP